MLNIASKSFEVYWLPRSEWKIPSSLNPRLAIAFLNASIDLKKGKYTEEPVQSSFGYHIILKLDQKKKPKLDKVKNDIRETLAEEKLNEDAALRYNALIEIREEAGIKFNDDSLKKDYDELMQRLIDSVNSSSTAS